VQRSPIGLQSHPKDRRGSRETSSHGVAREYARFPLLRHPLGKHGRIGDRLAAARFAAPMIFLNLAVRPLNLGGDRKAVVYVGEHVGLILLKRHHIVPILIVDPRSNPALAAQQADRCDPVGQHQVFERQGDSDNLDGLRRDCLLPLL